MGVTRRRTGAVLALAGAALLAFAYARPVTVFEALGRVPPAPVGCPQRARAGGALPPALPGGGLGTAARPGPRAGQQRDAGLGPAGRPAGPALPRLRAGPAGLRRVGAAGRRPTTRSRCRSRRFAPSWRRRASAGPAWPGSRWAGGSSSRLAGEHPEMVERLVVVDAAGMRPDEAGHPGRGPSPARRGGRAAPRGRGAPQRARPAVFRGPRHPGAAAAGGVDHPAGPRVDAGRAATG